MYFNLGGAARFAARSRLPKDASQAEIDKKAEDFGLMMVAAFFFLILIMFAVAGVYLYFFYR